MCALCSGGWLVARLMSSVSGRRTLRDHLYVFVCERRHLFRTVINSDRYRVRIYNVQPDLSTQTLIG